METCSRSLTPGQPVRVVVAKDDKDMKMTEAAQMASAQTSDRLRRRKTSVTVAFWERPRHEEKQQSHCVSPVRLYLFTIRPNPESHLVRMDLWGLGNETPLITSQ